MSSGLFAIDNLSSTVARPCEPWDGEREIPSTLLADKAAFIRHCQIPTTKGCHFSGVEALDPNMRVGKDNPAHLLHCLVSDFDSEHAYDLFMSDPVANNPTEFLPMWAARTFSGGLRIIHTLQAPVTVPHAKVRKGTMKTFARKLKLKKMAPGFDDEAFSDLSKYYEKGRDWVRLPGAPLPSNIVHQWIYEAGNRFKWTDLDEINIPMDEVYEEIEKQFPGAWQGPFEEGARSHRFWDESADNTTAAVVRASGMQCFTGDQGFLPWSVILGKRFVDQYEANRTGAIVADMFYDGKDYWRQDQNKLWLPVSKEDLRLMLKVRYGLSATVGRKDTSSEVDKVVFAVQDTKTIRAAMPFVHFPRGVITVDGVRYLNTSDVRVTKPAEGPLPGWGENFPFLAEFFDTMFTEPEAKDHLLAWFQRFYTGGLYEKPLAGQALFAAGGTNLGKTFMSTCVFAKAVGGFVDASDYLLGDEKFTSHVVSKPILAVDDTAPASDPRRHARYSAMIKKVTANRYQAYEEKFRKAGQVLYLGRPIITLNMDSESVKMLPDMQISNVDKVMLFRFAQVKRNFPDAYALLGMVDTELPYFLQWIDAWDPPNSCLGDSRFGVKSYHDKYLYNEAIHSSASYSFLELLADYITEYRETVKTAKVWTGTATSLLADMTEDARIGSLAARYSPSQVASLLGQLKSRGFQLNRVRDSHQRKWEIPLELPEQLEEQGNAKS